MLGQLLAMKKTSEYDIQPEISIQKQEPFENGETTRDPKGFTNEDWELPKFMHRVGNEQPLDEQVELNAQAIFNTVMTKSKKKYSKQYIPLGSIVDNAYLKQHQIKDLHFEHIFLNSLNQSSLHKVVFKHNEQTKQIRFYIPTFLRFSLIKLHSEDLKNITHIQNKNNMIIYINVYTRGLPKMLIDKLTKRSKTKDGQQEAKLLFRANRHLFEAKYYTSYNDYLIFMFNPFSEKMIEFEIMKNVMFAPFQQAELILHIRINKKVFKMQRSKTLKIAKSSHLPTSTDKDSPIQQVTPKRNSPTDKRRRTGKPVSFQSIQDQIQEFDVQSSEQEEFDILHFNKIIMEFKLQKPKNVTDSFRFHKSIEFGNYGIMTNEINIHIGSYESPEKKKEMEEERAQLTGKEQETELDEQLHEYQLQDISSMRLSIGLYKHPVTELCTFFIPLMLAGGLTLLLFHLCDHSLTNQLEVLAIILVAYGAFIPQFRQRISMSRTVIFVDFFIVYNMTPAILCALQSITESKHKKTYNIYQVISVIMYYASILFLAEIYLLYLYVDKVCFKKHTNEMVHNFDTDIFETQEFSQDDQKCLSWFVLEGHNERAFFCERQDPVEKPKKIKFVRKQTRFSSRLQDELEQAHKTHEPQELAESVALQIRMSATTSKNFRQAKQSEQEQIEQKHEQHELLYKTKVIQNERHVHSFEKLLSIWHLLFGLMIIVVILSITVLLSWTKIYEIITFQDLNKNCIHDEQEASKLTRVQNIIPKQKDLIQRISESWNDPSIPEPDTTLEQNRKKVHHHHQKGKQKHKHQNTQKPQQQQVKGQDNHYRQTNFKLRHHFRNN